MNRLTMALMVRPAFTGDRLFQDFSDTLKHNGLIDKSELQDFARLKPAVSLFAVTVMHNCVIQIGSGATCKLNASTNGPEQSIVVDAAVPTISNPTILAASAIYSTGLLATEYCDESIPLNVPWNFDLELSPEIKLTKLG